MLSAADVEQIKKIVVDPLAKVMEDTAEAQANKVDELHKTVRALNGYVRENRDDISENRMQLAILNQRCTDRAQGCGTNGCLPVRLLGWLGGLFRRKG